MKPILAYGTLRPGKKHFNDLQELFGKESIKSRGLSVILPNLFMVNLGYYPGISVTENSDSKVFFEAILMSDEVFEHVNTIETKSGFELISIDLEGDLGEYQFWAYARSCHGYPVIKSGDWEDA